MCDRDGGQQVGLPSGDGVLMRCICGHQMHEWYKGDDRQRWRCMWCDTERTLPLCRHCYTPMQAMRTNEMYCPKCGVAGRVREVQE